MKDRVQADSETYRERVWDWWLEVGSTRLAPGAPVIVVLTRWHEDDLVGRLIRAADGDQWRVVNIPAEADHDPAKGQRDVLGRKPGEFLLSARGRTRAEWAEIKLRSGARTWNALYQGRPAPAAGGMLQRQWWRHWHHPPPLNGVLVQSWDMAFKATSHSDYVVGQVWLHSGADFYLLDQVRGRWSFAETCRRVIQLSERWPMTTAKLVEDKANGTAVIDALKATVTGLIPVEPEGGKLARTSAISPIVEAGNAYLPPLDRPWVGDLIDEAAAFPNGAHDDQIDAMSQALTWLHLTSTRAYGTSFYDIG